MQTFRCVDDFGAVLPPGNYKDRQSGRQFGTGIIPVTDSATPPWPVLQSPPGLQISPPCTAALGASESTQPLQRLVEAGPAYR